MAAKMLGGSRPSLAIARKNTGLTQEGDEQNAGQAGQGSRGDQAAGVTENRRLLRVCFFDKRLGDRGLGIDVGVGDHARDDRGHADVQDRAYRQRGQNANGHVARRINGFFRVSGDGVEADVGEEDDGRPQHDALAGGLP